jgi:hypothetical protein
MQMADMNLTVVRASRKTGSPHDAGSFAAEIEKQANTLADSGWSHEATNLRKWASELRGKHTKGDYSRDR